MLFNETFENLPFNGKCKNLIDKFLIIGYDKTTFKNILNNFISKINDLNETKKKEDSKNLNDIFFGFNQTINFSLRYSAKFNSSRDKKNNKNNSFFIKKIIDESPLILNEFMFDFNKNIIDNEKVIEITFPNKYYIFYNIEEINFDNIKINKSKTLKNNDSFFEIENNPNTQNIIFSISPELNSNSKKNQNGISHIFYQSFTKKEKNKMIHIYFPIVFTIISEYPFWNHYISIFNLLEELYLNKKEKKYLNIHQIIYNLVSFSPSPLNSIIKINLNSIIKNYNHEFLTFPMLNYLPIIDYNLGKIISSISTINLITLFIITFLEKDLIFFSSNLEELNLYIYTFLLLNYPLNDSQYYWYCVSVSKESYLKKESPFVEKVFSSLLGINSEFNIKNYSNNSNEIYFYDIENHTLKINEGYKSSQNLISAVKSYIKKSSSNNNYNIKTFFDKIENFKKKLMINIFDDVFKIDENEKENNEIIQNMFFEFNVYLSSKFLNNINNNIINDNYFIIEYNKDILINNEKNKYKIIFYQNFQDSIKFQSFINNYIQNFSCLDFYKIPFFVFENLYFLKNNTFSNDINININDLFDFLYKKVMKHQINLNKNIENKNKENIIDFSSFFIKISTLFNLFEKNIIENNNKDDEFENIFIYELNNTDLFIYIYKLQELDNKTLLELFPFIKILENNVINKIDYIYLEKQLEKYLKNKNFLSIESQISNCIISLYCILFSKFSPKNCVLYFNFINSIFYNKNIYISRYYFYLILYTLNLHYDYCENSEKKYYILEIIHQIINEIFLEQKIFPNAIIFKIIKKFENDLKNRKSSNIDKTDFFKSISVKIFNKQNNENSINYENIKNIDNQDNYEIIIKIDENQYESDYLNLNKIYKFIKKYQNLILNKNIIDKFDFIAIKKIIINLITILNYNGNKIFSKEDVNSLMQLLGEFLRLINNGINNNNIL